MTKPKVTNPRHGKCCFCGNGRKSKEHIWPEWIHSILPQNGTGHVRKKSDTDVGDVNFWDRQGEPKSIQIRAVCKTCNNGWMNIIETQIRLPLELISKNEIFDFSPENLNLISIYFTMKFMVADQSAMSTTTFTDQERNQFFLNRVIPNGLNIILFKYKFEMDIIGQYNKEVLKDLSHNAGDRQVDGVANFTMRFGHLLVQGLYMRASTSILKAEARCSLIAHPSRGSVEQWNSLIPISLQKAYRIQHILETAYAPLP